MTSQQIALVTGCSSGIGRAAAAQLNRAGFTVYASARRTETLTELVGAGCRPVRLDVDDEASMRAALEQVGPVDVLVNNAGYGLYGPVEQVGLDEVRRQFETNVFGLVRLTQLVLPGMRARRRGRILNVSSMGGRTTLPGGGFYHASKYAVEAISDALRLEVRPFGVDVVLIEPGVVRTPWSEQAMQHQAASSADPDDPYADYKSAVSASFDRAYSGPLARLSIDADKVAGTIVRAATARRPRARYLISPMAKSLVAAKTLLPDRAHDLLLKQQHKLP
jgi:NAD(P)-dependent dehydrogenase (short-subunit alcohol dehydrogenase family)